MKLKVREHLKNFQRMSYIKDEDDEEDVYDGEDILDCAHGINPFGYSKSIIDETEVFKLTSINSYPQYPYNTIRRELSDYWSDVTDIDSNNIRLGSGSMTILNIINRMFIDSSSVVLGYCPQFSDYIADVRSYGGIYEYVVLKQRENFKFNCNDFLEKITKDQRIIYIDNPNNPTGQSIPITELIRIIEKAEKLNICVIIDEAYGDFMHKENSAINLVNRFNNLFVVRTFSKGFGLAGLRVGYMVCSGQLVEYYKKMDMLFCVNSYGYSIAQIALRDKNFILQSIHKVKDLKSRFVNSCSKIEVLETNMEVPIMVLKHPDTEVDLCNVFLKKKVKTGSGKHFIGLGKNYVRLRIPTEIDRIIQVVKDIEDNI